MIMLHVGPRSVPIVVIYIIGELSLNADSPLTIAAKTIQSNFSITY